MRKLFSTVVISTALLMGYVVPSQAMDKPNTKPQKATISSHLQGCYGFDVDSSPFYHIQKNKIKFFYGNGPEYAISKVLSVEKSTDNEFSALIEWTHYEIDGDKSDEMKKKGIEGLAYKVFLKEKTKFNITKSDKQMIIKHGKYTNVAYKSNVCY